jgi:hypothetical protein
VRPSLEHEIEASACEALAAGRSIHAPERSGRSRQSHAVPVRSRP